MLKPETGYSTQETQKCASRTRLNSSFRRAILERAVSALRAIQADSPDEPKPEGCAARPVIHQSPDEPRERIQVHALTEGEFLARLGGNGGDDRHDRTPLCSKQGRLPP